MKRIFAVLTVLVLFLGLTATAEQEDFTLYKGVAFGMSAEQVRETVGDSQSLLGKVAGQDNTLVMFQYKDDALIHCYYSFCNLGGDPVTVHSDLLDALTKKYGVPPYQSSTELLYFDEDICPDYPCWWSVSSDEFSNVYQWLIPYGDTNILIELNRQHSAVSMFSGNTVNIVYILLPPNALENYNELEQDILDDL